MLRCEDGWLIFEKKSYIINCNDSGKCVSLFLIGYVFDMFYLLRIRR